MASCFRKCSGGFAVYSSKYGKTIPYISVRIKNDYFESELPLVVNKKGSCNERF